MQRSTDLHAVVIFKLPQLIKSEKEGGSAGTICKLLLVGGGVVFTYYSGLEVT